MSKPTVFVGVVLLAVVASCGDSGGRDAGVDVGAPDFGAPCSDEGALMCGGGLATQCCGGHYVTFADGPCGPFDAGMGAPDCTARPEHEGCPCATEDARACRRFAARLRCVGGTWATDVGYACCD